MVHARTRLERTVHKAFGRLFRVVQVAAAHTGAADEQFTGSPHGQATQMTVGHVQRHVAQRMADRNVFLPLLHLEDGGEDGAFRGAVPVVEVVGRRRHGDEFFTAHGEVPQDRIVRVVLGIHHAHLGGHEAVGYAIVDEEAVQGTQVVTDILRNDADAGAAGEGGILVHHVGVEAVAGEGRHFVSGLELVVVPVPGAEVHQVAVLQHHALGRAGGAGSVQQDVQVLRLGRFLDSARRDRQILQLRGGEHGTGVFPYQRDKFFVGNEELGAGVLNHEVEALRGVGRIQRLVGATGLHGGQGGLGHPGVAINQDRNYIFFPETVRQDFGGQGIRVGIQFLIADGFSVEEHGRSIRGGLGLTPEQVHDGEAQVHFLCVVVKAVQLLEALPVHKGNLRERNVLQQAPHHALHGVGKGLDERFRVQAAVVGQGQFRGLLRSFDEDA